MFFEVYDINEKITKKGAVYDGIEIPLKKGDKYYDLLDSSGRRVQRKGAQIAKRETIAHFTIKEEADTHIVVFNPWFSEGFYQIMITSEGKKSEPIETRKATVILPKPSQQFLLECKNPVTGETRASSMYLVGQEKDVFEYIKQSVSEENAYLEHALKGSGAKDADALIEMLKTTDAKKEIEQLIVELLHYMNHLKIKQSNIEGWATIKDYHYPALSLAEEADLVIQDKSTGNTIASFNGSVGDIVLPVTSGRVATVTVTRDRHPLCVLNFYGLSIETSGHMYAQRKSAHERDVLYKDVPPAKIEATREDRHVIFEKPDVHIEGDCLFASIADFDHLQLFRDALYLVISPVDKLNYRWEKTKLSIEAEQVTIDLRQTPIRGTALFAWIEDASGMRLSKSALIDSEEKVAHFDAAIRGDAEAHMINDISMMGEKHGMGVQTIKEAYADTDKPLSRILPEALLSASEWTETHAFPLFVEDLLIGRLQRTDYESDLIPEPISVNRRRREMTINHRIDGLVVHITYLTKEGRQVEEEYIDGAGRHDFYLPLHDHYLVRFVRKKDLVSSGYLFFNRFDGTDIAIAKQMKVVFN